MRILAVPEATGSVTAVGSLGRTSPSWELREFRDYSDPARVQLARGAEPVPEAHPSVLPMGRNNTWHSLSFVLLRQGREGVGASAPARCHHGPPPCHTPHRWGVKEDTPQTLPKHLHLSSVPIQRQTTRDPPESTQVHTRYRTRGLGANGVQGNLKQHGWGGQPYQYDNK